MNNTDHPVVLVDMDGVLADFDAEVFRRINEKYPDIQLDRKRLNFYVNDDYPEHAVLIRQISLEPGFFAALPIMEGALEGWQRIIDLGYTPRICTSPIRSNPRSEVEKREWLQVHFAPHFGESVAKDAIVSSDKYKFKGIALIDDRPSIKHNDRATWQHIIFDKPYNHVIPGLRLNGWGDVSLGDLLAQCRQSPPRDL